MQTVDGIARNIEKLEELFPNCVTETRGEDGALKKAINFDVLRQLLSGEIAESPEAYDFTWVGKKDALAEAHKPIRKTLRPCPEESRNWDSTQNIYIEGDNLEVLKLLQESYLGKVKAIYIDPPYNTGSDSFVYNDNFRVNDEEYDEEAELFDDEGNKVFRENNASNPRFHSDWCSMIYSRLILARALLSEDGVIFISIDDNEVNNHRKICDEIFGEANFVASLVWAAGRKNDSRFISVSHEYILCYVKSIQHLTEHDIKWREKKQGLDDIYSTYHKLQKKYGTDYKKISSELKQWFKNLPESNPAKNHSHYCYVDSRGIYFPSDISWPGGGGPKYEVLHPATRKPVRVPNRGWVYPTKERMQEVISQGLVHFGEDETSVPCKKTYLKDGEYAAPYSVFYKDGRAATKELRALMGAFLFPNPKDMEILKNLLSIVQLEEDSLVMDFFSGSAAAAHAVMQLNAERIANGSKGDLRYILVQLPEACDEKSEAYKSGYKNICEIGKERIRRAGDKIKSENPLTTAGLDVGFRVFKADESNMKDVYYGAEDLTQDLLASTESNIKPDRTDLDLLFSCVLEWGLPLSMPYKTEQIDGFTVHTYNDGDLIACFQECVTEKLIVEIARRNPLRAVFRDSCFSDVASKINLGEIFKRFAPNSKIKTL